ncbi:methyltransferase domain-containing protein [Candidatus Woesearchaeota archaeon]|nr:methyltransferase domain-containing protein [Candidatus Woesearchaeota archaeon]
MDEEKHFKKLNEYFAKSEFAYDFILWGAKHFGFYPKNRKVSEKEAQMLMQDKIGEKLRLLGSNNVLDAGCGQGVVSAYLAKKYGCRITGITKVPFEIPKANQLAANMGVGSKTKYYLMDYSKTSFKDSAFDRIYTIETLCHSTSLERTLREFFRVLGKGGRIAMFEYNIAENDKLTGYEIWIINKVIESTASPSLRKFAPGKFEMLIKKSGFKNIKAEDITENFEPSLNRLRKFSQFPYFFVRLFRLQKYAPNLAIAVEFHKLVKKGLIKYFIFTAEK